MCLLKINFKNLTETHRVRYRSLDNLPVALDNLPAHSRSKCPARDAKCRGCGIKGHWVRFCLSKKVHEVDDRDCESGVYLGTDDESGAYL